MEVVKEIFSSPRSLLYSEWSRVIRVLTGLWIFLGYVKGKERKKIIIITAS